MGTLYTIRNWSEKYENAESRKIAGTLDWFKCPTKHDGLSYRRIMRRADGLAMYGAWILIVAVAAKCKPRGVLQSEDGPLTAEDIALKTGAEEKLISKAIQLFSSKEVAWLTGSVLGDESSTLGDESSVPALEERRGEEIRERLEETREEEKDCAAASQAKPAAPALVEWSGFEFPTRGKKQVFRLPASKLAEYRESYPGMDVDRELRKAAQWCRDNEAKRKTHNGMPAFLGRWLARCCDSTSERPLLGHATLSDKSRRAEAASDEVLADLYGARE